MRRAILSPRGIGMTGIEIMRLTTSSKGRDGCGFRGGIVGRPAIGVTSSIQRLCARFRQELRYRQRDRLNHLD